MSRARRVAEEGARNALGALLVGDGKTYPGMTSQDRNLRRLLRAHGRQLGDRRTTKRGEQEIDRLVQETAYEHWHRMLFARFLAENELLLEPESGVPVSLDECAELARERGEDPWEAAGRWASEMLPEIFRPDDPVLAVQLPPETGQKLRGLLMDLPAAVFTADDSLGWTYQYWQAERKDEVNASGNKIGADELPAVTQLFTERYMVLFLLHNTVGAWRAGRILAENPTLATNAETEDELREAVRLRAGGGYEFEYLRFLREPLDGDEDDDPTGPWRPAAGAFERWPRTAAKVRVLDPCCGSGHFLVETLHLLVHLRMEEEALAINDTIHAVLRDNLFGLELDPRCTQIAAFNVALAAWKMAGDHIALPPLEIACSGLAPNSSREDWFTLADAAAAHGLPAGRNLLGPDGDQLSSAVKESLGELHTLFRQAPVLGSLIDPRASSGQGDAFRMDFASLQPLLKRILDRDVPDADLAERAVAARGMAHAAELLGGIYTLVITNVPYLARRKQVESLRHFCESDHADAKGDLATVFASRTFHWLGRHGTSAMVTPQNWLFLTTYRHFRERLLKTHSWNFIARLGPGAFETITGHVVNVALKILSAPHPTPSSRMAGLDVSAPSGQPPIKAPEKSALLAGNARVYEIQQAGQLTNPDAAILLRRPNPLPLLSSIADYGKGSTTGDRPRYLRSFWEAERPSNGVKWLDSPNRGDPWSGRTLLLTVPLSDLELLSMRGCRLHGQDVIGRAGVAVQKMSDIPAFLYGGEVFDDNVGVLAPHSEDHVSAILCYCGSGEYSTELRQVDQKLNVTASTLVKVPFDLDRWQRIADEAYPHGLPEPYSDDPTQWIFHGDPCRSVIWDEKEKRTTRGPPRIDRTVLQVAVARLLGYRWPAELDPDMRLAEEQRELVESCRKFDRFADEDGIVCLSPTRGEASAADRLRTLLATAYDGQWSAATERELLAATRDKPPASLENWLRDGFFEEHCRLFHNRPFNRPFIWHIWDGRKDGFHALVNYHRLAGAGGEGRRTLETLTYSYVHDWVERQRQAQGEGVAGADARLVAALDLRNQLEKILAGEPPYDIFVRWRALAEQPEGWNPDLNDGVRLNIRPFMRAELRRGGRKGAGILRVKPNIKWGKDRGKEPKELRDREEFPWFWSCPGGGTFDDRTDFRAEPDAAFDGNRWNDLHYTRAAKRAARDGLRT